MNLTSDSSKRRRKKSFIGKLKHQLNNVFRGFQEAFDSGPKEYKPYLGPKRSSHHAVPENDQIIENEIEHHHHRVKRHRSSSKKSFLKELTRKWERRRSESKKRTLKRKSRKKYKKEQQKRARIDFIRRFLPNYKKENIPFDELSAEQASDAIKQHQKNYFYYTINSTALFLIAYIAMYMLYQLTVLIVASKWKLDSVLFYFDLAFNDYSPLWSRTNIIIVTFSGPFISLVIGFLFYKFFSSRQKVKGFVKLFFLWIALIGFNLFLGAWANGISFDQGFGYVPAWLSFNVFWQILVALLFLFLLGIIGFYSVPKFLDTSKSAYRVRPDNKTKFLFFQVILPWFIGSLIIILVRIPNILPYDTGNLLTIAFAVIPMVFNKHARPTIAFEKEKKPTNIRWLYVIIVVALLLLYRIGLNNGLHVTLFYDFTLSLDINPL